MATLQVMAAVHAALNKKSSDSSGPSKDKPEGTTENKPAEASESSSEDPKPGSTEKGPSDDEDLSRSED